MKKLLIALFIILVVALSVFFFFKKDDSSEDDSQIDINVNIDDGDEDINWDDYETYQIELEESLEITDPGVYELSGSLKGNITINTDDNVKLVLNNVSITSDNGPAIYVIDSKNVVIELSDGTYNTLTDNESYTSYDEDVNGVIYSECDLILQGSGTLYVNALYEDGIVGKDDLKIIDGTYVIESVDDAIRGRDSIYIINGDFTIESGGDGLKSTKDTDDEKGFILIENGTFNINAELDGIQAEMKLIIYDGEFNITTGGGSSNASTNDTWGTWNSHSSSSTTNNSAKGLKAGSNLVIYDGDFNINSSDDSIHSNGSIKLANGNYTISSGDDGVHADETLIINNGTYDINQSYEGLEASVITINNGTINITSSDDGINVAGGNDSSSMDRPGANNFSSNSDQTLTINAGTITIDASGDGIDVNGNAYINGGSITVYGPTSGGDGALDYDGEFVISGGTLIAFGSGSMEENVSSTSSQVGVIIYLGSNYSSSDKISIQDSDGNEILSTSGKKQYSSVVISCSSFELNKKYSIYVNDSLYTTFTPTSTAYQVGTSNMGNMRGIR